MRAQHRESLGFAVGKAEPPLGATTGGTPKSPQNVVFFFEIFFAPKSLEHLEKRTQGISDFGTRLVEPEDRLRLRDTASPLTSLRLSSL